MCNIVSAFGWETNPYANAESANNGGGYSQPEGGCVLEINGDLLSVEVSDTSCGDFGSRIYAEIGAPAAQMRWSVCVGTMDDASIDSSEEIDAVADSIYGVTGLRLDDLIRVGIDAARKCARGGAC